MRSEEVRGPEARVPLQVTQTQWRDPRTHVDTDTAWRTAPCAALVVDADGLVQAANDAAGEVFPQLSAGDPAPAWLTAAEGWVGPRCFEARPVPGVDGTTMWWLFDVTTARELERELRVERLRTSFLGETASALIASLNVERCMETAAKLATTHLAEAALVVGLPTRNRLPVVRCVRGGEPVHTVLDVDLEDLSGLAHALQGYPPVPSRWIDPLTAPSRVLPETG